MSCEYIKKYSNVKKRFKYIFSNFKDINTDLTILNATKLGATLRNLHLSKYISLFSIKTPNLTI